MKLTNIEIVNANNALTQLAEEELQGALKFKLYELKKALEDKHKLVAETLEGVDDDQEQKEILLEEQEIGTDRKLTEDELEPLPMSLKQLVSLKPFIEKRTRNDSTNQTR